MVASAAVRIRAYRPTDYTAVRRLWKAAGLEIGRSDTRAEIERTRRRDPGLFLVAADGRRVVGVVLGRFDGRRGWIHHLAVDPVRRREGVGARLVRELERRLQRAGCPKVNLHVTPANAGVVPFYERLGYRTNEILFLERWLPRPGAGRTQARAGYRSTSARPEGE